jgi:hypothetical protein
MCAWQSERVHRETVVTLLLHCGYTIVTLLLHCHMCAWQSERVLERGQKDQDGHKDKDAYEAAVRATKSVTVVSQWCYSDVTVVSHWCYSGVTVVLQWCYSGVIVVL